MHYLFFDTETTGLPNFNLPHNAPTQPHVVQLGAILCDEQKRTRSELNLIIRPDLYTEIPEVAANVHGITFADAQQFGVSGKAALSLFFRLAAMADVMVAHNAAFDVFLMRTMAERFGVPYPLEKRVECTVQLSTSILKLPPTERMQKAGRYHYKTPNLQEAHTHFMGVPFEGAHDAMADVRACRDVYFAIMAQKATEAA